MDEYQAKGVELDDTKKAALAEIDTALALTLVDRFEGNSRGDATRIMGGGRARLFVEDDGGGAVGANARLAVIHPMATTTEASIVFDEARRARGTIIAKLVVELGVEHAAELCQPAGDGGGPADRQIAHLARELTGKTDPKEVAQALLSHYVDSLERLGEVLGISSDRLITHEMRSTIARGFGLVEPPLPPYAIPGYWVFRQGRVDIFSRIAEVTDEGVRYEGDHHFTPAGLFAAYTCNMGDGAWAPALAERLGCPIEHFLPILRRTLEAIADRTGHGSVSLLAAEEEVTAEIKRLRAAPPQ